MLFLRTLCETPLRSATVVSTFFINGRGKSEGWAEDLRESLTLPELSYRSGAIPP